MSEQGHAKNLENFKRLKSAAVGWGANFDPSNPALAVSSLTAIIAAAATSTDDLQAAFLPRKNVISARADAFEPVKKLVRRSMNMLASSGAPESKIADARTFARKIFGERKGKAVKDNPATVGVDESEGSHSASQQSYTQMVEHLDNYIGAITLEPLYDPNEADLKTTAMQTVLTDLRAKNDAVIAADTAYDNKLNARDAVYYADATGLVDVARLFKKYVVGAFGADSPEYAQIKDLEFKKRKR